MQGTEPPTAGCPLLWVCVHGVCVCVFTAVSVHLARVNAEHKFRVWVTILGHVTSLSLCHFHIECYFSCSGFHNKRLKVQYVGLSSIVVKPILPIQNTQAVQGPRNTRGPLALKDVLIFVSLWIWPAAMKIRMIIYCNAVLSPFLREKQSYVILPPPPTQFCVGPPEV